MKIIYRNDFNHKAEINHPLDFSKIDIDAIEYDPMGLFIPIKDETLQAKVYGLAEDISRWNDWCYPDDKNIKTNLFVEMSISAETFAPAFQIEIQPKKWTDEGKNAILSTADKNMYGTDFSEYSNWRSIFASAEDWHNGNGGMCETIKVYETELTTEELKQISMMVISHLEEIISNLQKEKRKAIAC